MDKTSLTLAGLLNTVLSERFENGMGLVRNTAAFLKKLFFSVMGEAGHLSA